MAVFTAHADGLFEGPGLRTRCALGRSGVVTADDKREGDGASPSGSWPMRHIFYRPDREAPPKTGLPIVPLRPHDGWCDDPRHPLYNRPVSLPFEASHEVLWRDAPVYDLIVVLGHNDAPVRPGRGSAIFLHLATPGYKPTEGCIALRREDLLTVLASSQSGSRLDIRR